MKLKTLLNVINDTAYEIKVTEDDNYIDTYIINYLTDVVTDTLLDSKIRLPENILNAKVRYVSTCKVTDITLCITVEL